MLATILTMTRQCKMTAIGSITEPQTIKHKKRHDSGKYWRIYLPRKRIKIIVWIVVDISVEVCTHFIVLSYWRSDCSNFSNCNCRRLQSKQMLAHNVVSQMFHLVSSTGHPKMTRRSSWRSVCCAFTNCMKLNSLIYAPSARMWWWPSFEFKHPRFILASPVYTHMGKLLQHRWPSNRIFKYFSQVLFHRQ